MPWWQFALLGALGGAVVETLAIFRCFAVWQDARRNRDGTVKLIPPEMRRYVDVPAHMIMLPSRVVLGGAAAVLCGLTGQVTGAYGAVAIGCAAPVLLAQMGSIPQVAKAVHGASEARKQADALDATTPDELTAKDAVSAGEGGLP